jgi:hypothetical protein
MSAGESKVTEIMLPEEGCLCCNHGWFKGKIPMRVRIAMLEMSGV